MLILDVFYNTGATWRELREGVHVPPVPQGTFLLLICRCLSGTARRERERVK
jgi:hypothetical protein